MEDPLFRNYEAILQQVGSRIRDDIAQDLYAARVILQRQILLGHDEEGLGSLKEILNGAIRNLSAVATEIDPINLGQMGFAEAIDDLIYLQNLNVGAFSYNIDPKINQFDTDFQLNCFRILQIIIPNLENFPTSNPVNLRLVVQNRIVSICLDGFLNLPMSDADAELIEASFLDLTKGRLALSAGTLRIQKKNKEHSLVIKLYN